MKYSRSFRNESLKRGFDSLQGVPMTKRISSLRKSYRKGLAKAASVFTILGLVASSFGYAVPVTVAQEVPANIGNSLSITAPDGVATLIVEKEIDGGDAEYADFSFTLDGDEHSFEADGSNEFTVNAGGHVVEEVNIPEDYYLLETYCRINGEIIGEDTPTGIDFEVQDGETVTCTFTNVFSGDDAEEPEEGNLIVKKNLKKSPADTDLSQFSFSVDGQDPISFDADGEIVLNIEPGTHTIVESELAGGWGLIWTFCRIEGQRGVIGEDIEHGIKFDIKENETVTCTFTNQLGEEEEEPEESGTTLNLYKAICSSYSVITGNEDADVEDDTNGNYVDFTNSPAFDPYPAPVDPSEIPDECQLASGWQFKLATNIEQTENVQVVGPTNGSGVYSMDIADLNSELQAALDGEYGGVVWISEVEQPGLAEFAAIRCFDDAVNGDNKEFIYLTDEPQDEINCVAYNVAVGSKISANKVVCLNESDLPNWGESGTQTGEPAVITASTAEDYVANNQNCHLEEGWSFQWGLATKNQFIGVHKLPGGHIGQADGTSTAGQCAADFCGDNTFTGTGYGDWKDFDTMTSGGGAVAASVIVTDLEGSGGVWVRENLQDGYVPFSYPPDGVPGSNVSAEIYCHDDIQNYDNYDQVTGPVLGETYYCVAFNAIEEDGGDGGDDGGNDGPYTLNIVLTGDGEGKVEGEGISCDSLASEEENDCSETYPDGIPVELTATPHDGSSFDNSWHQTSGTCTGTTSPCQVTMDSDITLEANFNLPGGRGGSGGSGGSGGDPDPTPTPTPTPTGVVQGADIENPAALGGVVEGATLPRTGLQVVSFLAPATLLGFLFLRRRNSR